MSAGLATVEIERKDEVTMSPWRVNDTVAFDVLQENTTMLGHLLTVAARSATGDAAEAYRQERRQWHARLYSVDGRDAVDGLTATVTARIDELRSTAE